MMGARALARIPRRARRFLISLVAGWAVLLAGTVAIALRPTAVAPSLGASLPGLRLGEIVPDFTLDDTVGHSTRLSTFRGHSVLLNFWSPTCVPCVTEMPALERGWQEARNIQGGRGASLVLGVEGTPDNAATVAAFGKKVGATYPLLLDSRLTVSLLEYHVSALPTSVLIDPRGRLRAVYLGPMTSAQIRTALGVG
jgi:peroxiredoxin